MASRCIGVLSLSLPNLTTSSKLRCRVSSLGKYRLDNGRVLIFRDHLVTGCRRMDNQECGDGHRLVDENMILLRLRIKEMEMMDRGEEITDPHWMEWEKKYFMHFHEVIYQLIGYMQHYLMSLRPCLALGIIAFVISSVVFSTVGITFLTMEMFKEFTTLFNIS